jgi:hypothetical protein
MTSGFTNGQYHQRSTWADNEEVVEDDDDDDEIATSDVDSPIEGSSSSNHVKSKGQEQFEQHCTRTVLLSNLAEGTTHADITNAVRGGMLLDIFLRSHERCATVSFLRSADARKFCDHVRRHDLYIKNKRVISLPILYCGGQPLTLQQIDVRWNDRQFVLPGHVAGRIAKGATRNLVLRAYDNRHTEEVIRADLDHIHNLVVIKVEYIGNNCYISLNSVHNAIHARQCMLTRLYAKPKVRLWRSS